MDMLQGLSINLEENCKKDVNLTHKNGWDLILNSKSMLWELTLQAGLIVQQKMFIWFRMQQMALIAY